jgi:hypothetical protein
MSRKQKIDYLKNYSQGKNSILDDMGVLPVKILITETARPDVFTELGESGVFSPAEVEELEKTHFVAFIRIISSPEDLDGSPGEKG